MSKLRGYLSSLRENFKLTRRVHRWVGLEMLGIFIGVTALVAVPVSFFLNWLTGLLVGLLFALLTLAIAGATGIASARMGGRRALAR